MATYYINGNNSSGVFPYSTEGTGASNFYELLTDPTTRIVLNDGDEIVVFNPATSDETMNQQYAVDDSSYDIDITASVTIRARFSVNLKPIIKLKSGGDGFNVSANDVTFKELNFHKDDYNLGKCVCASSVSNFTINECDFTFSGVTQVGIPVRVRESEYVTIYRCEFTVPSDASVSTHAIELVDCQKCDVKRNIFDMSTAGDAGAVYVSSYSLTGVRSYGIHVYENVIYNMTGSNNFGIEFSGPFDNSDIFDNVIRYKGSSSYGILFNNTVGYGTNIDIKNNVLLCEDDTTNIGVYVIPTTYGEFNISNNIIYNDTGSSITNAYGMDLSIPKGYVNNNCIYGFGNNIINFSVDPTYISEYGNHMFFDIDPLILNVVDDTNYATSAYNSYLLSAGSEMFGVGEHYEHIGINSNSYYVSFVDTVTHQLGKINNVANQTFLNTVFTESIESINNLYSKSYTESDNYENQFRWESPTADDEFPFTVGTDLYDKDIIYVIQNRDQLVPFENITCPANPGYNFSAYPGYETGIFGHSRAEYINTCLGDPCIIQDDVTIEILWVDGITEGDIVVDTIDPPCISGGA